jgi:hypothetical protein
MRGIGDRDLYFVVVRSLGPASTRHFTGSIIPIRPNE